MFCWIFNEIWCQYLLEACEHLASDSQDPLSAYVNPSKFPAAVSITNHQRLARLQNLYKSQTVRFLIHAVRSRPGSGRTKVNICTLNLGFLEVNIACTCLPAKLKTLHPSQSCGCDLQDDMAWCGERCLKDLHREITSCPRNVGCMLTCMQLTQNSSNYQQRDCDDFRSSFEFVCQKRQHTLFEECRLFGFHQLIAISFSKHTDFCHTCASDELLTQSFNIFLPWNHEFRDFGPKVWNQMISHLQDMHAYARLCATPLTYQLCNSTRTSIRTWRFWSLIFLLPVADPNCTLVSHCKTKQRSSTRHITTRYTLYESQHHLPRITCTIDPGQDHLLALFLLCAKENLFEAGGKKRWASSGRIAMHGVTVSRMDPAVRVWSRPGQVTMVSQCWRTLVLTVGLTPKHACIKRGAPQGWQQMHFDPRPRERWWIFLIRGIFWLVKSTQGKTVKPAQKFIFGNWSLTCSSPLQNLYQFALHNGGHRRGGKATQAAILWSFGKGCTTEPQI